MLWLWVTAVGGLTFVACYAFVLGALWGRRQERQNPARVRLEYVERRWAPDTEGMAPVTVTHIFEDGAEVVTHTVPGHGNNPGQ